MNGSCVLFLEEDIAMRILAAWVCMLTSGVLACVNIVRVLLGGDPQTGAIFGGIGLLLIVVTLLLVSPKNRSEEK
jgi:hypothetical protein